MPALDDNPYSFPFLVPLIVAVVDAAAAVAVVMFVVLIVMPTFSIKYFKFLPAFRVCGYALKRHKLTNAKRMPEICGETPLGLGSVVRMEGG